MRAFTDPLPLRTTAAWTRFRDVRVIPHRYGRTAGELLQYDAQRRIFVWADHPATIATVQVDGQNVQDWRAYSAPDSTGRAVQFVEFGQPVNEGVTVSATGTGKVSASTGAAIATPADVLWDILVGIAGMDVEEAELDTFRAQSLGFQVAGSITEPLSIQSHAIALCQSFGAVFGTRMPGYARVLGADLGQWAVETITGKHGLKARAERDDIVNAVTITFAYDHTGPRQSLTLEAPDSIDQYGRREATLEAPWIGGARTAYQTAQARLQEGARPAWAITATGVRSTRLRPGMRVDLDHPRSPYAGAAMVLSAVIDAAAGTTEIGIRVSAGSVPRVVLVQQAAIIEAQQYASVTVQTQGTDRLLTVQGSDGAPLANARVVLDGQLVRYSDSAGRVLFPVSAMPLGEHTLEVSDGTLTLTFTVLVQ